MALDHAGILERAREIRLAVFDVDGVLTDGRLILGPQGEEYKAFHVRDGYGLVALRGAGIEIAVITGRRSAVVEARMAELGIERLYQGVGDKSAQLDVLLAQTGVPLSAVCYVGDDLPDRIAMSRVALPVAVADACPDIIAVAAAVTQARGGHGAVREVCDLLIEATRGAAPAP